MCSRLIERLNGKNYYYARVGYNKPTFRVVIKNLVDSLLTGQEEPYYSACSQATVAAIWASKSSSVRLTSRQRADMAWKASAGRSRRRSMLARRAA